MRYATPAFMVDFKRILVSVDFAEPSIAALRYGIDTARAHGAVLHILHVVNSVEGQTVPPGAGIDLADVQHEIEADASVRLDALIAREDTRGLQVRPVIVAANDVADAIIEFAASQHVDLIVMGTHGSGSWMRFFVGSVAQQVVRSAGCPVTTVRPPLRDDQGMVATPSMPDVCALHH